ncbi:MAG: putative toxin-antitoxin system toxin component, PIN family [Desulfosalsimonadaceae bacterium]
MTGVVIDTNVVISALLFGGVPGRLVPLWRDSVVTPYISREILAEYIQVLSYPKFQLQTDEIEYLVYREILPHFEVVDLPASRPVIISKDPSDDLFLYCARAAGVDFIVSGDRHLLQLQSFGKIPIVSVPRFLDLAK